MTSKPFVPPKLYKYESFSAQSICNLKNSVIYFSSPLNFNDPFDCNIPYHLTNPSIKELNSTARQLRQKLAYFYRQRFNFKKSAEDIVATKNDGFKNMGIACFSEVVNSKLMWSHYTDGHKGFCLEFDTSLLPFVDNRLFKVKYRSKYPSKTYTSIFLGDVWLDPVLIKSIDWKYEKEWRIIVDNGNQTKYYPPDALIGIYFGCNMEDQQTKAIQKIDFSPKTKFYKMKKHKKKFLLFPKEVSPK